MTAKKLRDLSRRVAAYALVAAFVVNPLAAQERYYFRNVQGTGISATPPTNPQAGTLSVPSANVTVGQAVNILPVAQNIPLPITWTLAGSLPANLAFDPSSGAITGNAASPGTSNLTLTARNGSAQASANFSITVSPVVANPPVIASYPSSFTVVAGETLSIPGPSVTSGKSPFTYGIIPVNPPFSFSTSTGSITWTPGEATTVSGITVRVTDADQASDVSNPFSIVVNPALTAGSYGGPKELIVGDAANFPLVGAGGGIGTLSYAATGLPGGLSPNASGSVVGTATVHGEFTGSVTVSDSEGRSQATAFMATVYPALSASLSAPLPASAERNAPISPLDLVVTGGKTPYSYTTAGDFPPGLSFANGTLSGTPLTAGTYNFELRATESLRNQQVGSGSLTLVVTNPALAVQVTPAPPTTANVGGAIPTFKAMATGGTAPYAYTLEGNLPPGVELATDGTVSGTPTVAAAGQVYNFGIRVTDSAQPTAGSVLAGNYGILVTDASPIQVTYAPTYEGSPGVDGSIPAPTVSGGSGSINHVVSGSGVVMTASTGAATFNFASIGTYGPFTVTSTDSIGRTKTSTFSIAIKAPPAVDTPSLPAATQGQPTYLATLSASGGTTPYVSWTLRLGGTVVANNAAIGNTGLVWRTNGTISGAVSATASTQSNLVFTATDSFGRVSPNSMAYTLSVSAKASAPTYPSTTYTSIGEATSITQLAGSVGGTAPLSYGWATAPSNTTDITIDPSSGQVTVGPGLPAGSYAFTVVATDANGVAGTPSLSRSIQSATKPTVTTVSLPSATQGASYSHVLAWSGGNGTLHSFVLTNNGSTVANGATIGNTGLVWNANSGSISGTVANVGSSQPNLSVTVRDSVGRVSAPKSIPLTVNLVPSAPTYASTSREINTNTTHSPTTPSVGGAGGTTYEIVSISPTVTGIQMANASTGQISIAVATAGAFEVTVRARDTAGTTSPTSKFVVTTTNVVAPYLQYSSMMVPGQGGFYNAMRATGGNGTFFSAGGYIRATVGGTTVTASGQSGGSIGKFPGTNYDLYGDGSFGVSPTPLTQKSVIGIAITARDSAGNVGTATVNILASLLAPTYPASTAATSGTARTINRTAPAYGGTGTLSYSVASTPPDAGVTVDASGNVTVASTVPAGTYSLVVTATDGGSPSVGSISSSAFSVTVASAPTVTTNAIPQASNGVAYSFQMEASGGSGALTFSSTGRPPGVNMSSTGLLSGTPTTNGTYSVVTTVTDSGGRTSQKTLSMVVAAQTLVAPTYPASAVATLGTARTIPVTTAASGGTGAKTYAVASTPSNVGITVNASGTVSIASSVTSGTYSVVVTTTDAGTPTPQSVASSTISVNVAPAITISTNAVDSQAVNSAYSFQVAASGGSGTLSFLGTNMPPGLSISSTGAITGTPSAQGSYVFTVEAYDAFGRTTSKNFSMTVGAANTMLLRLGKDYYDGTVPKETLYVCDGYVPNSVCSSGGPSPAMLHYSMTANSAGQFTVYVHHSTADSRPVNIYVNGTLILYGVAAGTNGTYYAPTTAYEVGKVYLNAGANTVSIQTTTPGGALPHIEWLQLNP